LSGAGGGLEACPGVLGGGPPGDVAERVGAHQPVPPLHRRRAGRGQPLDGQGGRVERGCGAGHAAPRRAEPGGAVPSPRQAAGHNAPGRGRGPGIRSTLCAGSVPGHARCHLCR